MSEFTGMALYTKDEIGRALKAYEDEVSWANKLLKNKITEAENNFKPTTWDKFWGNTSLKNKKPNWTRYKDWLYDEGYLNFTEEEYRRIEELNRFHNMYAIGNWLYDEEHSQVKSLYNGGKDCYLNPHQAAFVNKYKSKGE